MPHAFTSRSCGRTGSDPLRRTLSRRDARRGMLLLVILALLVVLSVIGIAFGFLVSNERHSAQNALDRFRAMSAARDGEAFAIAHLRQNALTHHYESEGSWSYNRRFSNQSGDYAARHPESNQIESHQDYLKRYAADPQLNSPKTLPSLSRDYSSDPSNTPDLNWIDANGDGQRSAEELRLARDSREQLKRISYFVGDGIDMRLLQSSITNGTYRELGDRVSLKVIDTNAQLNINDYSGRQLEYMLIVLGNEIAQLYDSPRMNPFPPEVALDIVLLKESSGGAIYSKEALRPFFRNEALYHFTMDLIALGSWPTRASGVNGTQPQFINARDPQLSLSLDPKRHNPAFASLKPFGDECYGRQPDDEAGQDGNPELMPDGERGERSPININTVSKPVLTAILAGIEAQARFFYFPRAGTVSVTDRWLTSVQQLSLGTTDFGQQPVLDGALSEADLTHGDLAADNLAIYQGIPIGPLGYTIRPSWKSGYETRFASSQPAFGNHASQLAQRMIDEREQHGPYMSWADFDYRICHQILLGFNEIGVSRYSSDLVNSGRTSRKEQLPTVFSNMPAGTLDTPEHLLPHPSSVMHAASARNSTSRHSYSAQEFDAWYWRASVDMIRANLNPNGYLNKFNPDSAIYTTVDSSDLVYSTAPLCFNSCGVYEITSQGEIVREDLRGGADRVMARRRFRSIVEIYRIVEHTTQHDFLQAVDNEGLFDQASSSSKQRLSSLVSHDLKGTITYPSSINHARYEYASQYDNLDGRSGSYPGRDNAPLQGGYFDLSTANRNFGWITQYPRDVSAHPMFASPLAEETTNFHARYNIHLAADPPTGQAGNSSTQGIYPVNTTSITEHADAYSSASPDPRHTATQTTAEGILAASAPASEEAALYATLRPDGVLLRGWHLNPSYRDGGSMAHSTSYGLRQERRQSRLALLRYRAGSIEHNSLSPINGINPNQKDETLAGGDTSKAIVRLVGPGHDGIGSGGTRGTDSHNIALQDMRQKQTNFPYYRGWIDCWIKWELPPQGRPSEPVCAGEIDPGSGNFSGLIGACSYGRFGRTSYRDFDNNTDFEGSEFFVFKEPGGVLRISHIYFTRAESVQGWVEYVDGDARSWVPAGWKAIGSEKRISGSQGAIDEYVGTNDICSGDGDFGFSYARMDSYVDLNEVELGYGINLVTHNWYRLSIGYRADPKLTSSQRIDPHQLYIDGKPVPLTFRHPTYSANEGMNTGELTDEKGNPTSYQWPDPLKPDRVVIPHRSQTTLIEVDPEDRLTIGGIFRRQNPLRLSSLGASKEISPMFRFDTNLVAPANATLDDVRITHRFDPQHSSSDMLYKLEDFVSASRYARYADPHNEACYENAFVASPDGSTNKPYPFASRVASISWTSYRPWWDSYAGTRVDTDEASWAVAPQVTMSLEHSSNHDSLHCQLEPFASLSPESPYFWRAGGITIEQAFNRPISLANSLDPTRSPYIESLRYKAYFIVPTQDHFRVHNSSAVLDDVRIALLTPPQRVFAEELMR